MLIMNKFRYILGNYYFNYDYFQLIILVEDEIHDYAKNVLVNPSLPTLNDFNNSYQMFNKYSMQQPRVI